MTPRIAVVLQLGLILLAGCGEKAPDTAAVRDTLTRRQKDSIIGASRLPGAAGVRGALRAVDTATARNDRLDSIRP